MSEAIRNWFRPRCRRLIAVLIGCACGSTLLLAQSGSGDDPVPVRRLIVDPKLVAKELDKVQQGTLMLLPLKDFEARLQRARQKAEARAHKPRLARAHYSAELIDLALTNGSGQWTVQYAGADPSILPIEPLNLALTKLQWEQGGDALLAELDGKSLGLLVKPADTQTCLFDWSARGTPTNDGITFNLDVPPCPISTLDLKLPADYWLSVPKGNAVVTGPHEAESFSKRLWKVQITGQAQVEITARKVAQPKGPAPTLFARVQSTQHLKPDQLSVEHEFQVDILHGSVRELVLDGDPALQPFAVLLASGAVKQWQWQENAAKAGAKTGGVLTIQFHQPVQGTLQGLRVRSVASLAPGSLWTSPALRVRGAKWRGETLKVRRYPDTPIGKWDHGSFQPVQIATDSDGTQVLTLAETAADARSSRRPSLLLLPDGTDLHTTENYQWRIDPRGALLEADIQFALTQGSLSELLLKLPVIAAGYQVESMALQPADLLRGWHLSPNGDTLIVELKQALTLAKKTVLKLRMRTQYADIHAGFRELSYPELQPLAASKREGTLSIIVNPILQARLLRSTVPLAGREESPGPPAQPAPTYRFTFRDQRLSAAIRLVPQSVQVQLRGKHAIALTDEQAVAQFRWEVEPVLGAPAYLDFRFAPGFPANWRVKAEEGALKIQRWERLQLAEALPHLLQLGAQNTMQAALLDSVLPTGARWRFHLSEPLQKKGHFTIEANLPAGLAVDKGPQGFAADPKREPAGLKVWSVPLITPVSGTHVDQEMIVDAPNEPIEKITADGALALVPAPKGPIRFELPQAATGTPASRLTLWTRPEKHSASLLELCDEAQLTTYVRKDGSVYQRIQFRLWHWRERTCDLQLAADFQVVSVKIHGQPLERLDVTRDSGGVHLTLPFDQNAPFVRYEIVARSTGAGHVLPCLMKVSAPTVVWPVAPVDIRNRVCLENGWLPLNAEAISPLGVPGKIAQQAPTLRWLRQAWRWGESWWPLGDEAQLLEALAAQKQTVRLAEAQLRGADPGKPIKLADALERLAMNHLKEQTPLVIDGAAFRSLGLSGQTMLTASAMSLQAGRPFWESVGLVYVPCPSGALLTSPQRLRSLGIQGAAEAADLDASIQEAILHGRDSSSGFHLILTWLLHSARDGSTSLSESSQFGAEPIGDFHDMTEWDLNAGSGRFAGFYLIDPWVARVVGWLLALGLLFALWRFLRVMQPLSSIRAMVLVATVGILIVVWSPLLVREYFGLPAFFATLLGLIACWIRLVRQRGQTGAAGDSTIVKPAAAAAVTAVGLLLWGITWGAAAQGLTPRTYTVLIIEGAKPAALVTPDLLAKLDELENQPFAGAASAVLVNAKYAGKIKDSLARFEAQYEVHSFKDQANLLIPLTGVQLQEGVFLDGVEVFPTPHKSGFVLPIRTKGAHHLRLTFTARVSSVGDQAELRFSVPKLVQNAIAVHWSGPVQMLHCLRCLGEEKRTIGPGTAVKHWQAQLGRENAVQMRWTTPGAIPGASTIEVREAHFWDLRPATPGLWTALHYSVGKGNLDQLTVAIPEGLHVRSVTAAAPLPASALPLVIKNWHVKEDQRQLFVELVQPVTGNFVLNLEIVPQFIASDRKMLSLPAPLQGKSVSGHLGYRLDATEVRRSVQKLAVVQNISAAVFEQQWKALSSQALPAEFRALSFQRNAPPQVRAGLELDIQPNPRQAQFHLQWNLEPHHAELLGKFTVNSPQEDLFLLEFAVEKTLVVAEVSGPDVGHWHRQDAVVQVWLRQPRKQTTLDIVGWHVVPAKTFAQPNQEFTLPGIYPRESAITAATMEVRPPAGMRVALKPHEHMHPNPADATRFVIDGVPFQASIVLRATPRPAQATLLTKVQVNQQGTEIWHHLRLPTDRGVMPNLKLQVDDWPFAPFDLEAPGAVVQVIRRKGTEQSTWNVKYLAGLPREITLTLRGRAPKDKSAPVPLGTVKVEGATIRDVYLAWQDVEIQHAESGRKLSSNHAARAKINESWLHDDPSWNCAEARGAFKAIRPRAAVHSTIRVIAVSEETRRSGRHWLHASSIWVNAPETTELRVKFPAPIEQLSALTDRQLQSAWGGAGNEFVLPFDGSLQPRLLELRWKYSPDAETLEAPSIAAVHFDQAILSAHERVIWIPPGMAVPDGPATPTQFERLLHEAQTHMQLSAALAQEPVRSAEVVKAIARGQQQFYASVRQADYALGVARSVSGGFDAADAVQRLEELKLKNADLAKERRYESQRKAAENDKNIVPARGLGKDQAATGIPMLLSADLPALSLPFAQARADLENRTRTELIALAAIFVLVFSYLRLGFSIAYRLAPEIVTGFALLGMWFYGLSVIGSALIAAMLLVRALTLVSALRQRLGNAPATPDQSKSAVTPLPPVT